jgi:hypothetical protein
VQTRELGSVDGWSIDELGLGVEPHFTSKVKRWQLEATDAVSTPSRRPSEARFPRIFLPPRFPFRPTEQEARTISHRPSEAGFARTWWARLSPAEQAACIGSETSLFRSENRSYEAKGALAETYRTNLLPIIQQILATSSWHKYSGSARPFRLACNLVLLEVKTDPKQKLIPTILVVCQSQKVAKSVVSMIRVNKVFRSMGFGCIAVNEIIQFL